MNQYLQIINRDHVLSAALFLLANPVAGMQNPRSWAVDIEGHRLPTKALIRQAYCHAAGITINNIPTVFFTDRFTTQQAVAKLSDLGFDPRKL